jgi:hypothetical protein
MAIESILAQIDEEIAKLTQIRAMLATTGKAAKKVAEPKAKKAALKTAAVKKRRVLSPEARKRIADAQRKRWAAQKAKSK